MNDKKIKIGVIGVGYRFSLILKIYSAYKNAEIIAAADPNIDAQKRFLEEIPTGKIFNNIDTMLSSEKFDVIFIMSPDFLHEEHAIKALKSGANIFIEKPMAISGIGCENIRLAAKKYNKMVYIGHNMRHMEFVKKIKEIINSGIIGEVKTIWCRHFIGNGEENYFNSWHAKRENVQSLLVHKGSHDIDIIQYFAESFTKEVSAMGDLAVLKNYQSDVEDLAVVQMKMHNGVIATYHQVHFSPDSWRNYTVIGTKGRVENFGDRVKNSQIKIWLNKVAYNPKGDLSYKIKPDNRKCDLLMLKDFFLHLKKGKDFSLDSAQNAVVTAVSATKSMRNGGNLEIC